MCKVLGEGLVRLLVRCWTEGGADEQVAAGYVLHVGYPAEGEIKVGDKITTKVDYTRRSKIVPNHTFTHVLNLALRDVRPSPVCIALCITSPCHCFPFVCVCVCVCVCV
jgi:Ser-tRNA(Ala) deacylase AlaX